MAVYNDTATFSTCNTVIGPYAQFPVPLEGDDISDDHRGSTATSCRSATSCPTFDPPKHTAHRGLLMRLITPKRLKENEEFMWQLADRQIDEFLARGEVRVHPRVREPVHAAGHRRPARRPRVGARGLPRGAAGRARRPPRARATAAPWRTSRWSSSTTGSPTYIEERRREPRDDVMTELGHRDLPRRLAARGPRRRC